MRIRALDADGDWTFGKGKNNYLSGNDGIGLNIATRIRSWLNDCFFDMKAGVDWLNRLGLKNQKELLEADLRRIINQSFGVVSIVTFSINITAQRRVLVQYTVQTIYDSAYTASVTLGE